MLCPRCNLRKTPLTMGGASLCSVCNLQLALLKKEEDMTENEVIEYHTTRIEADGCKECGDMNFGYEAGIQEEKNGLKWFVVKVQCGACNEEYDEILEVRIDEYIKSDEEE